MSPLERVASRGNQTSNRPRESDSEKRGAPQLNNALRINRRYLCIDFRSSHCVWCARDAICADNLVTPAPWKAKTHAVEQSEKKTRFLSLLAGRAILWIIHQYIYNGLLRRLYVYIRTNEKRQWKINNAHRRDASHRHHFAVTWNWSITAGNNDKRAAGQWAFQHWFLTTAITKNQSRI